MKSLRWAILAAGAVFAASAFLIGAMIMGFRLPEWADTHFGYYGGIGICAGVEFSLLVLFFYLLSTLWDSM